MNCCSMVNVKVSLLGEGAVGKTSIKRIFSGQPVLKDHLATIGSDFTLKDYVYTPYDGARGERIRYMIYDLAGQQRFKNVRGNFMDGSHAGIFVYDISNRASLDKIPEWLVDFKSAVRTHVPLVLVANKIDLREQLGSDAITTQEGIKMAEKLSENTGYGKRNKFYFVEVSALQNLNINKVFDYISHEIYDFYLKDNRLGY